MTPPPAPPYPVTQVQEVPLRARRLAMAGLLPFALGALLMWVVWPEAHPYVALGLSAYAALIVSFLGGVYWGLAMRNPQAPLSLYAWGLLPSAPAWVAVMMPPSAGLVIDGLLLAGGYLVDRRVYPEQGLADWLTLRFRLSMGAALCCFLGAAAT